jgi:hypothetical protein
MNAMFHVKFCMSQERVVLNIRSLILLNYETHSTNFIALRERERERERGTVCLPVRRD